MRSERPPSDPAVQRNWAVAHLAEFLAAVGAARDEDQAELRAIERAAVAAGAEVAAIIRPDGTVRSTGIRPDGGIEETLRAAAIGAQPTIELPGMGMCRVLPMPIEEDPPGWLVLARTGGAFTAEEVSVIGGMSRALSLRLAQLRLYSRLEERHTLMERLFHIQHSISHRAPIQEVLDAITEGAAELLGDGGEIVALRLLDDADPRYANVVSTYGVNPEAVEPTRHTPITEGLSGRAITEGRIIIVNDYERSPFRRKEYTGLTAGMAAPVHRSGEVIGALVVSTTRTDGGYTEGEQGILLALAEHASIALNDASAVAALRRALDDAMHQARHDPLTGLPNRNLVLQRLSEAIDRQRRHGDRVSVLFLDIDRFKLVNDFLGHGGADKVLVAVAERLCRCVRPDDTVGRLAGDEFVVVCTGQTEADALAMARRVAEAMTEPLAVDHRQAEVTVSIGIATADGTQEAEDLLGYADAAMYLAKERGRSRIEVFDTTMREGVQARSTIAQELRGALDRREIALHFQPVFWAPTNEVLAVEALVRWNHPRRGLIPPGDFIPIAEDTGLIVPIGAWVLRETCRQVSKWRTQHPGTAHLQASVNLSARQLADPTLATTVTDALAESGLPAGALWLELTESALIDEADATMATLEALRDAGAHLVIDDFGTGYSSLHYLKRFPVESLKIDCSFVDGLGVDPEDEAIVTAVISLATALGLGVVAEGVETVAQLEELARLGCDTVQGFLFKRPAPADELGPELLRWSEHGFPTLTQPAEKL